MTTGTYEGMRTIRGCGVLFNGKFLDPCTHLINYRASYFWGDDSPGTMQLALAMLVHCYGGTEAAVEAALRHHRDFARDVLASIETDTWAIFHEQLRQMLEVSVSTFNSRTPAGRVVDTLVYRRDDTSINAAAQKEFETLVDNAVMTGADKLPEVIAYLAIRGKSDGISEALQKIDFDLRQLELDREKATATLQGVKLATKLASIEANRNSLAAQVTEVEKGGQLFQRDVENARVAASEALQRHFEAGLYVMREEAKVRVAATKEPVRKVAAIFRAMDEAATARRLRELVETHAGVKNRVFAVMAGPVA